MASYISKNGQKIGKIDFEITKLYKDAHIVTLHKIFKMRNVNIIMQN